MAQEEACDAEQEEAVMGSVRGACVNAARQLVPCPLCYEVGWCFAMVVVVGAALFAALGALMWAIYPGRRKR
jgi:hypothetical protein